MHAQTVQDAHHQGRQGPPDQQIGPAPRLACEQQAHTDGQRQHQQPHPRCSPRQSEARPPQASSEGQLGAHHHLVGQQEPTCTEQAAPDQELQKITGGVGSGHGRGWRIPPGLPESTAMSSRKDRGGALGMDHGLSLIHI